VITSFADRGTQDIYDGNDTKAARKTLPKELWSIARRKLDMIDAARSLHDLKAPPSNELEKLKRDLAGKYSIRINKQWRVIFEFADGLASNIYIGDPH